MDENRVQSFVGSKALVVECEPLAISFNVLVHYPTNQLPIETQVGLFTMLVSPEAHILSGRFPLIVVSHGNGGSHLLYRTISTHLAKNGYIVAMVEHYGNNRNDNHLENTTKNLIDRPRHISMTIDFLLSQSFFNESIATTKIAVIGHSLGGYTALALAGGIPRTKEGLVITTQSDSRLKAIVLLAPGAGWFLNSLSQVTIPIFLLAAEHDPITPLWNSEIILKGVPDKNQVTHMIIENAGHFSFLSPFPETMRKPSFLPAHDPVGFDRELFHQQLPSLILPFLDEKLI